MANMTKYTADGVTYDVKDVQARTEVADLKSAFDGNVEKGIIQIDGHETVISSVAWEQGNFTTSNDSVVSTKDVRTVTWFDGGVWIYNPTRLFQFSVMTNDGSGSKSYYTAFNNPVSGVQYYYDDALAYLPKRKVGTYRIKVSKRVGGTGTKQEFTPNQMYLYLYKAIDVPFPMLYGVLSSEGYAYDLTSLVSEEIQLGMHTGLRFRLIDDDYRFAVYSTSDSTSYSMVNGVWQTQGEVDVWDTTKKYVCRVGAKSGVTWNYENALNAVEIEYVNGHYAYQRNYTDITYSLQWSQGNVTANGVDSDTHYIHAELPCVGNVEVKLNWPSCKFTVWKKDDEGNYTRLTSDAWSYYFCRYNSDDKDGTVYYVVVTSINETTSFTKFSYGKRGIKAYIYEDTGVFSEIPSPFYGKTIAVMGDSIVQGRFRKGNAEDTNSVHAKPWPVLIAEASNTEPGDFGIGGATVYGDSWLSLYTNRQKISGYDVVLVCAGTNDFSSGSTYTSETDFKAAYGAVLDALIANNTQVIAVTPTRRRLNSTNAGGLTLRDYSVFITDVAASKNVPVIDLYAMSYSNQEFIDSLIDGIHPNESGQRIIADLILNNVPPEQ